MFGQHDEFYCEVPLVCSARQTLEIRVQCVICFFFMCQRLAVHLKNSSALASLNFGFMAGDLHASPSGDRPDSLSLSFPPSFPILGLAIRLLTNYWAEEQEKFLFS